MPVSNQAPFFCVWCELPFPNHKLLMITLYYLKKRVEIYIIDLFDNPSAVSEKFEKLVRAPSLLRYFRTVSTKREKIQGLAEK